MPKLFDFYFVLIQKNMLLAGSARSAPLFNSSSISSIGKGRLSHNIDTIKPSPIQITNQPPTTQTTSMPPTTQSQQTPSHSHN